ncbi:MAG: DegT/DnrJ/EryC1/StrS family aminotransferase [Acidobacteria bacterium]|nr:DegT/DnrJ/EryC1/StrS family aminotransferase [Acidobacteriota bacterium]
MHSGLKIPVSGPSITQYEADLVAEAVRRGWYEDANFYSSRFERALADYTGRAWAIALPSCTSAIHLALAASGIGPGDEVIVPELTWIATSAPVQYVGASPVFADVEPDTWCIDPAAVARLITPRTRAIIGVDLYGNLADWEALEQLASRHSILLIEDAAEAIGAMWSGRRAGNFGDAAVFSFHGSKTLTTGEGGMLVTNSQALHDRIRCLCDHGRAPGDRMFLNQEVAYKYKMSAIQAALGIAQLDRIRELTAMKHAIFAWYESEFRGLPDVWLNQPRAGSAASYWMSTIVWRNGPSKEDLMAHLDEHGVDSRPFFHPLSSLPAYRGHPEAAAAAERNKTAYRISRRGLNLPSALRLTEAEVRFAASLVRRFLTPESHPPMPATAPGSEAVLDAP